MTHQNFSGRSQTLQRSRAHAWPLATLLAVASILTAACSDYGASAPYTPEPMPGRPAPVLTSVTLILPQRVFEPGEIVGAQAIPLDQYGEKIISNPPVFASSSSEVARIDASTGFLLGIANGTAEITATIDGVVGRTVVSIAAPPIRINEIVSHFAIPGGFVELTNVGETDIDLGGFTMSSGDFTKRVTLPAGLIVPAKGFLAIAEANIPNGLGARDAVHLFNRFNVEIDGYSWVEDPQANFSRCPDGDGPFYISNETRKAANDCDIGDQNPRPGLRPTEAMRVPLRW